MDDHSDVIWEDLESSSGLRRKTWKGQQQIGEITERELTVLCYVWWEGVKKCILEGIVGIWGFDGSKKETSFDTGEQSPDSRMGSLPQNPTSKTQCNESNLSSLTLHAIICQESKNNKVA